MKQIIFWFLPIILILLNITLNLNFISDWIYITYTIIYTTGIVFTLITEFDFIMFSFSINKINKIKIKGTASYYYKISDRIYIYRDCHIFYIIEEESLILTENVNSAYIIKFLNDFISKKNNDYIQNTKMKNNIKFVKEEMSTWEK